MESIERREAGFAAKEEEINKQKAQIAKLNEERLQELERISGLTSEQAKEYLLKTVEEDVKLDTAKLIKEMEHRAKEEADKTVTIRRLGSEKQEVMPLAEAVAALVKEAEMPHKNEA